MALIQLEIQVLAALAAVACALTGSFLVLRRAALLSDAISHVILLGIVVMFFVTRDANSPLLILGAAATGLLTVTLISALLRTGLVREDAAIGLAFPLLFSLGVILVSRYAENIHLDTDSVLLGEIAFAPFDRLIVDGLDLGPRRTWVMGIILALNFAFIVALYKELKLATFDPALAATLGFSPTLIHYLLMSLVSVTAVGAFDAGGAILVVALLIVPPAAAYILTDRLAAMLSLSALIGIVSAIGGYWLARALDASIAGSMAAVMGIIFGLVVLGAPQRGLVAHALRYARQRWWFAEQMLVMHLLTHEGTEAESEETVLVNLPQHLRWELGFAREVAHRAERDGLIRRRDGALRLTDRGHQLAQEVMLYGRD